MAKLKRDLNRWKQLQHYVVLILSIYRKARILPAKQEKARSHGSNN
nr:MAG TPA: hypothetical protein [Caudoviricetes sp.]